MSGDTLTVYPTVLYRSEEPGTLTAAVIEDPAEPGGSEARRAMLVFRSEEEAEKYRAVTGNNPASEGWRAVSLDHEDLANVIAWHECSHVAMPEPWTGRGLVDYFDAGAFIGMLAEAAPA